VIIYVLGLLSKTGKMVSTAFGLFGERNNSL
jgi:hypothetical protein